MPRLTGSVFRDLAIWMAGFGLLIGLVFPPCALLLGVPSEKAIGATFYAACLAAGALVGGVSWGLARLVVGSRLRLLADRMSGVAAAVADAAYTGDWLDCQANQCRVSVDSEDEIGQAAHSFNALIDALSRAHDVEAAVDRFGRTLSSELDLDELVRAGLEQLLAIGEAAAGALLLVADGEVALRLSVGIRDPGSLAANVYVQRAVRSGRIEVVDTPEDVRVDGLLASFRPRQAQIVPVGLKTSVLAVLVLASSTEFRPEARRLVELLRPTFGLALNNAMIHERLQRLAALDPLTDLYNRRFGLARLHEEFSRSVRTSTPLGLVMVDVDRFKSTNDTYGHVVGDRALRAVARACRRGLREGDVLVRYGGDELLAILPGAAKRDVVEVAERMRRIVAETPVVEGEQTIAVSISAGVSSLPEDAADSETILLQQADAALYEAKQLGRDRVAVASLTRPLRLVELSGHRRG